MERWNKTPAIVRYDGESNNKFTKGKKYEAYFLEYWEGERNSLHVRGDNGKITDFNPFEDFTVISDLDNVLNRYEAIVQCKTHEYENMVTGLTYGKKYKAIGCDKDGLFLVMDNSYSCYFYSPDEFDIIEDKYGILSRRSVYYSFYNDGGEL